MEQGKRKADKRDIMIKLLIFILGFIGGMILTMVITLKKLESLL